LETLEEIFGRRIRVEHPVADQGKKSKSLHQIVKEEDLVVHLLPDVQSFTIKLRTVD